MDISQLIEAISQYGVIPIMVLIIFWNKKELDLLKSKVDEINKEHKADLKQHTEEMKALIQSVTEAINTNKTP